MHTDSQLSHYDCELMISHDARNRLARLPPPLNRRTVSIGFLLLNAHCLAAMQLPAAKPTRVVP